MMRTGMHPAEAAERALIPVCTAFRSFMFRGRGLKEGAEFPTLAEAAAHARALEIEHRACGRLAAVYGVTSDGRRPLVPRWMWPET